MIGGREGPRSPRCPHPPTTSAAEIPNLTERLDIWVAELVIGRMDADAIVAFESGRGRPTPRGRVVTPLAEALAYLGAALAVAAGGNRLGGEWDSLSTAGRIDSEAEGTGDRHGQAG